MKNVLKKASCLLVLGHFLTCVTILVFGSNEVLAGLATAQIEFLKPQAIQIIQEGLADDDPRIRAKAIEVVADTRQIRLMSKVQHLLRDDFVPVRFSAALAVGDTKYYLAKNPVEHLLKDPDENVRIAAAYAMTRLDSADKFKLILKAARSKNQKVRANATILLGKSGDQSALKPLYTVLRDKDSDYKVRLQAVQAIAGLGDRRIYPKVWTMLISAYADDRVMGISAMGALGTTQAKDTLITMLSDDILEVRLAAAEQLGMLGNSTGEPEVLDVFKKKKLTAGLDDEDLERVNMRTALAIGQIGTASLTGFLPRLLNDRSKTVRTAAAKAVFQCTKQN